MIDKITTAILNSRKIRLLLVDGRETIVHPHIVIQRKHGERILKAMGDDGDCLDVPLRNIRGITILSSNFAVDTQCLHFDFAEYELVFPKREDWIHFTAGFA